MAKPEYLSLSKRIIDRLSVDDKDTVFWDRDLPGFGIRVYPSGAKVYVVQTRVFGRSKRVTVGRHGQISPDQARKEAARIIARIKAGEAEPLEEPAPAPTVADLAERYQREYVAMHCKPADRVPLRSHAPQAHRAGAGKASGFGGRAQAHHGVSVRSQGHAHGGEPGGGHPRQDVQPSRCVGMASIRHEPLPVGAPLQGGEAPRAIPDTRGTPPAQPGAGRGAKRAVGVCPFGAAAIRLLVLTGCRRNEILGLRWEDLDFEAGEMRLADSKTGARVAPLPPPAARVLAGLSRVPGNPWLFPGKKKGTGQRNINDSWDRVRKRAGLEGVRLHDLRHSFASRALALGESLSMIGELLGHRKVQTTARYAHLARDSVRAIDGQGGGKHRGGHPSGVEQSKETDNGEVEQRNDLQAYGRRAAHRRTGDGVLGPGAFGLRGEGLSLGIEGLPRADPRRGEVETGHHRAARAGVGRAGSAQGGGGDREHQGWAGPRGEMAPCRQPRPGPHWRRWRSGT